MGSQCDLCGRPLWQHDTFFALYVCPECDGDLQSLRKQRDAYGEALKLVADLDQSWTVEQIQRVLCEYGDWPEEGE